MRVFIDNYKINFVDENNIFVGYDLEQQCCEHAGWYITDSETPLDDPHTDKNLEYDGWNFCPNYFEKKRVSDDHYVVVFRLVKKDKIKYLHIFNIHNGWYCHGFEFINGDRTREGIL